MDRINQFLFAFGIIALGLILGRILRLMADKQSIPVWFPLSLFLSFCIRFVLLGINPIILIGAFWYSELSNIQLIYLPVLGIATIMLGGLFGILLSKYYKLSREQTGSMFVTGSFVNLGSFGALFCVLLLGEQSLAYVAMFRLFEELFYYTVCYPIAKSYGQVQTNKVSRSKWSSIIRDPFIMITFFAVVIGGLLNLSSWVRFDFYGQLNQILVPLASVILLIPVGFSMRLTAVKKHFKLSISLSAIKCVMVPAIIVSLAVLFGLGELFDGYLLKVILIMAAMPTAVSALVPPQLYKLDVELANSNWIVNTTLLLVIIPVLYFIIPFI
ncbi:AEC family transporter [Alkalicoccobacillus murimartini]|uniref:Permease n=1 Tax=Alkalicoccobacillus murimartini TaxID=171685 RepID=A0ABT9YGS1_9BACI|nr:AEC family transporter [Alkalicoccobacillus murimartini]MDQ0206685.1 putative permease [Alkalicoccobacillus murimartini]